MPTGTADTYYTNADDDLRLTQADPYCALVRAIIVRAFRDSCGRIGTEMRAMDSELRVGCITDAIHFFNDGRFAHWCELLGANPEWVLREMRIREAGN